MNAWSSLLAGVALNHALDGDWLAKSLATLSDSLPEITTHLSPTR
jgi:hypothetical protein